MMTEQQLQDELNRLGVTPPDTLRAAVYLPSLQSTHDFFRITLAHSQNLGSNYSKVRDAVRDPELLNRLCEMIDEYIVPAIKAIRGGQSEQAYLTEIILTDYPNSLQTFFNQCVVTRDLVARLTALFQANIQRACQRIIRDWHNIQRMFVPRASGPFAITPTLDRLIELKSTGSDRHKGGTQVFFLTFALKKVFVDAGKLRLVYKPADIEIDCLLVGDSAAVNRIHHNFQQQSLTELINEMNANATLAEGLRPLPTYKILPYNYGSQYPVSVFDPPRTIPVRDAYGYVELLGAGTSGLSSSDQAFGIGHFKLTEEQDENQITHNFFQQIGQLIALAVTFALTDLHSENLIVKEYQPHLIDLETSLVLSINDIADTALLGGVGALEPVSIDQNLLYDSKVRPIILEDNIKTALRAFVAQMQVLRVNASQGAFGSWLARVEGSIARYVSAETMRLNRLLGQSANEMNCNNPNVLYRLCDVLRGVAYESDYLVNTELEPDPKFFALQNEDIVPDYQDGDIPTFYHQIGTKDIRDSRGGLVRIADTVRYRHSVDTDIITRQVSLQRDTFFRINPTQSRAVGFRLDELTRDPDFDQRKEAIIRQVAKRVNSDNVEQILSAI